MKDIHGDLPVQPVILSAAVLLLLGVANADSRYGVVHGDRLEYLEEGGFGWTRMDFVWNGIEPQNGTFKFDELDRYVDNCTAHGIRILAILDYSAEWASSAPENWSNRDRFPPKHLSDWEEYVFETVTHFKGRVTHWEVWNEPNIRYFWLPKQDPREYSRLLRSTYATAKKADPECTILIGGIIGFDVDYLRKVYEQGSSMYFDVVSLHPYLGNDPFDLGNFSGNMSAVKALISEFGDSNKEIWFTEMGWPTSENTSKEDQAAYLIRGYVLSLAVGADKLFWFNLNAAPPPEGSSGLIEHDLTPRPAFWAHKAFAGIVGQARYDRKIEIKAGIHAHLFHESGQYTLVLWHPNRSIEIKLRMDSKESTPKVFNMVGDGMDVVLKGRSLKLEASPYPLFISNLTEKDVKAIESRAAWILPLAFVLIVLVIGGTVFRLRPTRRPTEVGGERKEGPRKRHARRQPDVPGECRKRFVKTVCLKCRHYVIQGGRGYCRKFALDLE